jgi:hypothetical protein
MHFAFSNLSPFTKCDEDDKRELPRVASHATGLSQTSTINDENGGIDEGGARKGSVATIDSMRTAVDDTADFGGKSDKEMQSQEEELQTQLEVAPVETNIGEDDSTSALKRPWWHPISLAWLVLENWFLVGLGTLVVLAWAFPKVGMDGGCELTVPLIAYQLTVRHPSRIHRQLRSHRVDLPDHRTHPLHTSVIPPNPKLVLTSIHPDVFAPLFPSRHVCHC